MALIALLKGINVGGHRSFRPSTVARALPRLGIVNVGAAGTFVIRKPVSRARLRTAIRRQLPFPAEIVICTDREIRALAAKAPFAGQPSGRAVVQFVSVLARRSRVSAPHHLPDSGRWCVRVLAHEPRFVLGIHRREMKAILYLGHLEKALGVPITTRSWTTIQALVRILASKSNDGNDWIGGAG
jgi:uncharacterized protein (DUF1697 family)